VHIDCFVGGSPLERQVDRAPKHCRCSSVWLLLFMQSPKLPSAPVSHRMPVTHSVLLQLAPPAGEVSGMRAPRRTSHA
jgi:hypothetical protein